MSAATWLDNIKAFSEWFGEKGSQIEPSSLVAFGIPLQSRYGKAFEMIEMLAFAQLAAESGVAGYVGSVFYNSRSCCCEIELKEEAERQPDAQAKVDWCGDQTLSSFTTDGARTVRGRNL